MGGRQTLDGGVVLFSWWNIPIEAHGGEKLWRGRGCAHTETAGPFTPVTWDPPSLEPPGEAERAGEESQPPPPHTH